VLGSPFAEIGGLAYQGRAYVIFGASGLSGEIKLADLEQPGAGGAAQTGFVIDGVGGSSAYRVMGLGDVNGDGVDDLGISSHTIQSSNRGGGGGGAFVVFGRGPATPFPNFPVTFSLAGLAEIDNAFGFVIYGDQAGENAGEEMAALGNINADGYADFALSAINHASSKVAVTKGKIYGIYGAADIQSVEVREAHHEGATVNRRPTLDDTKAQHNVGHAFALLLIVTLGFIYRLFVTRRLAASPES